MSKIEKVQLGENGPLVSRIGLGCMRMSPIFGQPPKDDAESIATIRAALDEGINFLNTGDFYASGHNELLIREAIKGRRDEAFISVKFGAMMSTTNGFLGLDMRPNSIKNFCDYSLVRLGVDTIDLYQPCRIDPSIPIEDIVGAISDLIGVGKVKYLGVSELTTTELRKAHSVYPVTAVENKYSIFNWEMEEELLPAARELGIGIVAYGNTADGLLSGNLDIPTDPRDYRNHNPIFHQENLAKNLAKVEALETLAREKKCSLPQLAIAWVLAQGKDIMPLVGMSKRTRLPENLAALEITLTDEEIQMIND